MSSHVTLFNKGHRHIHGAGFVLKPQQGLTLDAETAVRLRRLYPDEVMSIADVQKDFEEKTAAVEPAPETQADPETKPATATKPKPQK